MTLLPRTCGLCVFSIDEVSHPSIASIKTSAVTTREEPLKQVNNCVHLWTVLQKIIITAEVQLIVWYYTSHFGG